MKNTEITVQLLEKSESAKFKLEKAGFDLIDEFRLFDRYFSYYYLEEIQKLEYSELMKKSILVRRVSTDTDKDYLIYKLKEYDDSGVVLCEEKYSTRLTDADEACKILRSAGLTQWCELVNNSYVYKKDKTELAIQVVPDLGLFLEYEADAQLNDRRTPEEIIETLINNVKTLDLKFGDDFSCKKPFMLLKAKNYK